MAILCPKCHSENTDTARFCSDCGTQLTPLNDIPSITKTLQTPVKTLVKGSTFAGRYKIIEELGRGGMGVVYKAEDTKLKRIVALKFLPAELISDSEARERFLREAQAAAALDHTNICTIYEVDETEGRSFISMAYVEGQTLRERFKSGPLRVDETLDIALQVTEGLREAHKKEIIHRDIKSANIMVDEKGQAKIMDFGLAKVTGASLITKEAKTMGTIAYMSPEQARGEEVDHRTDIWSFGIVLYEMLTGQLPFRGEKESSLIYSIEHREPVPLKEINPSIPAELEHLIKKSLAKNPKDRYQNVADLRDDLFSISKGIVPQEIEAAIRRARFARKKRRYMYAAITIISILLVASLLYFLMPRAKPINSLAVLPLDNLSGDPDQEHFADSMTEALIAELGQVSSLRVISRTSAMMYKGAEKPLTEIAEELGVDAVVEGSVVHSGGRVRITVQLIQARPEKHLWARNYTREIHDILDLQEEVSRSIVQEINVAITADEKARLENARPVDPEVYDLFSRGLYLHYQYTEESWRKSIDYFEKAIEKDPDYAPAYFELADLVTDFVVMGYLSPHEGVRRGKELCIKAIELDESLGEAYAHLGWIEWLFEWDWEGAERELKRALEINPNSAYVHGAHYHYLAFMTSRYDEAIAHTRRAMEIDPLNPLYKYYLCDALWVSGQIDRAIEEIQKLLEMAPDFGWAYYSLGFYYFEKQMFKEAILSFEEGLRLFGKSTAFKGWLGFLYGVVDQKEKALEVLNELIEESREKYVSALDIAQVYIGLREIDQAFEWLDKAYEEHAWGIVFIRKLPSFDLIRSDPRYQDLLRRMNLPELE